MMEYPLFLRGSSYTLPNFVSFLTYEDLAVSYTFPGKQVPSANAIFFNGDRVAGTENPVIERLSDLQNIAEILVSKIGGSTNAWVIDASVFNGPFAVYRDFIPSVNQWGEPKSYCPIGYPASGTIISLLSSCLEEVYIVLHWPLQNFIFLHLTLREIIKDINLM